MDVKKQHIKMGTAYKASKYYRDKIQHDIDIDTFRRESGPEKWMNYIKSK